MRGLVVLAISASILFGTATGLRAADLPPADSALKDYTPVHQGVEIDRPDAATAVQCKISAKKIDGMTAVLIESPEGIVLRAFCDVDGNGVVDQWRYFKDGLEVYRDIDANGNNRADQYRWFHGGGSRWGIDRDEDGTVDAWKSISAEEVTAEIVAALANRDTERFMRVTLSPTELKTLGLGPEKAKTLGEEIGRLKSRFKQLAMRQKVVGPTTKWLQFSGSRPGVVPAGTAGSTKDLQAYENVVAIAETDGAHTQVQIGTLVRVGDTWRAVVLPTPLEEGQEEVAASGLFFNKPPALPRQNMPATAPSNDVQLAMTKLQELDAQVAAITDPAAKAQYHDTRADLLEQVISKSTTAEDKAMWTRQLADTIGAAVQSGEFAAGIKRLESLVGSTAKSGDKDLEAYVAFRKMSAEYGLTAQAAGANDFTEIHKKWLENLEAFSVAYPTSAETAEAMLQIAIAHEFVGEEDKAKQWYGRIAKNFPATSQAKKASGAQIRIDSVGKVIKFQGEVLDGGTVDLSGYRGKVVVIQYWASWCQPKADMAILKELATRYTASGFEVIGVNLDSTVEQAKAYLAQNPLPWKQIYEAGGLDSRPANDMGIHTVPTMLLIDQQGRVVNRNVHVAELYKEIPKLIR